MASFPAILPLFKFSHTNLSLNLEKKNAPMLSSGQIPEVCLSPDCGVPEKEWITFVPRHGADDRLNACHPHVLVCETPRSRLLLPPKVACFPHVCRSPAAIKSHWLAACLPCTPPEHAEARPAPKRSQQQSPPTPANNNNNPSWSQPQKRCPQSVASRRSMVVSRDAAAATT